MRIDLYSGFKMKKSLGPLHFFEGDRLEAGSRFEDAERVISRSFVDEITEHQRECLIPTDALPEPSFCAETTLECLSLNSRGRPLTGSLCPDSGRLGACGPRP